MLMNVSTFLQKKLTDDKKTMFINFQYLLQKYGLDISCLGTDVVYHLKKMMFNVSVKYNLYCLGKF